MTETSSCVLHPCERVRYAQNRLEYTCPPSPTPSSIGMGKAPADNCNVVLRYCSVLGAGSSLVCCFVAHASRVL